MPASAASTSSKNCASCGAVVTNDKDVYCRSCGGRILLKCSKCGESVRARDGFCAHCGARRYYWLEMWRNRVFPGGQGVGTQAAIIAAVGAAWLVFFVAVKRRFLTD